MRERKVVQAPSPLLALIALAGCTGDDFGLERPNAGDFTEWDSAGVRMVESSGSVLETAMPWVVQPAPSMELGRFADDPRAQFHDIRGIVGLANGGLVVLDGASAELRWFDAFGGYVRTAGGAGQGPGEFVRPVLVPRFQTDSLLIFDRGPGRRALTWVAIDGSGARALGPGGRLFAGTPRVSAGSSALFASASSEREPCPTNEGCDVPLLLRWVDVTGARADTLVVHPGRMMTLTGSGPAVLLNGPLDQRGVAAVGPVGPVVEGDPRFELRQFDDAGRLIAIFRVDAPALYKPSDAFDRFVRSFPDPDELRRLFEPMGLPDLVPAFQALQVDPLGWYWAELFRPDEGERSEWLVFDPEGRARGTVELPTELEVHEIGESYVLGRWIDELGVEHVRRHALDRRGP